MKKDRIIMDSMSFYGFHGVLEAEKQIGQKYIVSIDIFGDFSKAAITDNVENAIDYSKVYERIKSIVEKQRFDLIEALAQAIADDILNTNPLADEVRVEVRKPQAPVPGIFESFGVEIWRRR